MTPATTTSSDRRTFLIGLTIAIIGAIFFSTKAIVAKLIYRYHVDAVTLIAFRMLFSLPAFAAIAVWKAKTEAPLSNADRVRIVVLGLLGYYLSSYLDFLGLQYISAGLERLTLFMMPSFVLVLSFLFFKRKIARMEWAALVTSYIGMVLVFIQDVKTGGENVSLGCLLVLGCAITYAIYMILSGEMVKRVGALRLAAYGMCVSSAACIGQFFLMRPASMLVQAYPVIGLSLVMAIFCTVLPVFMSMISISRIGAATTAQATMIGPVSTLFLGAVLLGEPVTAIQIAGTLLVLSGIYLLTIKRAD